MEPHTTRTSALVNDLKKSDNANTRMHQTQVGNLWPTQRYSQTGLELRHKNAQTWLQ